MRISEKHEGKWRKKDALYTVYISVHPLREFFSFSLYLFLSILSISILSCPEIACGE